MEIGFGVENENAVLETLQRLLLGRQVEMTRRQLARAWSTGEMTGLEIFGLRHGQHWLDQHGQCCSKQ